MKFPVFCLALVAVLFTSCSTENDPASVCAAFQNNVAELDFDGAKSLSTESTGELLDLVAGMLAMGGEEARQEALKDAEGGKSAGDFTCDVEGDRAVCSDNDSGEEISLRKVDGQWLVDIPKEDLDKEE